MKAGTGDEEGECCTGEVEKCLLFETMKLVFIESRFFLLVRLLILDMMMLMQLYLTPVIFYQSILNKIGDNVLISRSCTRVFYLLFLCRSNKHTSVFSA